MLEPDDRSLLLDAFRPPEGFGLTAAVGTTFTLDLEALLLPPLALAMFDAANRREADLDRDPVALLEAVRRTAEKIALFCQAGCIAVPRKHRLITCYLEASINEVVAPNRGYVFHPKLWCLRFDDEEGGVQYRLLCASRNLTFDRSWDTLLVLDGSPTTPSAALRRLNEPLCDLLGRLRTLSVRPTARAAIADRFASELRSVEWTAPPGLVLERFHTIGLAKTDRVQPGRDRTMIVSPFVSDEVLRQLATRSATTLVSRAESLDLLEDETLESLAGVFILDPNANGAEADAEDGGFSGLHAKLFVLDDGTRSTVLTGSSNATDAGLAQNVEFMVELSGSRRSFGADAVLRRGSPENPAWRDLLVEYRRPESLERDRMLEEAAAAARLDRLVHELAGARWLVKVDRVGDEAMLEIQPPPPSSAWAGVSVSCCPVTLGRKTQLWNGEQFPTFGPLDVVTITPFVAVHLQMANAGRQGEAWFVVNAELEGDVPNRHERILANQLSNARDVLRYLLFLLSEGTQTFDATQLAAVALAFDDPAVGAAGFTVEVPLLEALLRTLSRDPRRLDVIHRLVNDLLVACPDGSLLPEEFLSVWEPMWAARQGVPS